MKKIKTLFELPQRILGPFKTAQYINIEDNKQFNILRKSIIRKKGISVMLRAKNEEKIIAQCIHSIANVFNEIIFIDNGSTDNTLAIVQSLQKTYPHITIYKYPFKVARCGLEHNTTNENSLSSLVYFYNWCLSKCTYSYVIKWDADMVLSKQYTNSLIQYLNSLSSYWPTYTEIEIQSIYLKEQTYYLSKGEINREIRIFPNRADVYFCKGDNFERLTGKFYLVDRLLNSNTQIFEVKNVDEDEFAHWDTTNFITERKKMEYERFTLLKNEQIPAELFTTHCIKNHF